MSHRASPAVVGVFVLGAILLGLGGIILLGSKDLFRKTYPFVSYFQGSVNGLREGAPVKFKGVEIGSVDEIRLPLTSGTDDPIVVFFSLDAARLRSSKDEDLAPEDLERAIDAGLRAQLELESFVTGLLYLSLAFLPDSEAKLHEPIEGTPEIPTAPTELEELAGQIRSLVDRLDEVHLAELIDDLDGMVRSLSEVVASGQIQSVLNSLDQTLVGIGEAVANLNQEIGPLAESLRVAADRVRAVGDDLQGTAVEARQTLDSIEHLSRSLDRSVGELTPSLQAVLQETRDLIDPTSPPLVRLDQALAELGAAAHAARAVLEILERDPAALVRGKGQPEEQR